MDFKLGKNSLNFRVYTASAFPDTGNENDICVISDAPMKNWILSPDAPSGAPRTDGDVWIQYSVEGNTFNALKNIALMVATISAHQYVDGVWVSKSAKSYQDGAWVDWYRAANIIVDGVISDEYGFATHVIVDSGYNSDIIQNDGYLLMQTVGSSTSIRCTDKKVNLTGITRIELDVDALTNHTHGSNGLLSGVSLVVLSDNRSPEATAGSATTLFVAQAQTKTKGRQTLSIDNSNYALHGEYYIGVVVCAYGSDSKGKANIYSLKCVR